MGAPSGGVVRPGRKGPDGERDPAPELRRETRRRVPEQSPPREMASGRSCILPGVTAIDAGAPPGPVAKAKGKSMGKSLLNPQELAQRLLPAADYGKLMEYSTRGVRAECGEPWPEEVIQRALAAGPHVSASRPDGAALIWEDIQYQVDAGFVKVVSEEELFAQGTPKELKVSRVAVVPQQNRRDRIILNLSAEVAPAEADRSRRGRKRQRPHPSVNETTVAAEDQAAVQKLGQAIPALLRFMFETDCEWEIWWQKIDLSDGFWRMVVEAGAEKNFVFQMPPREGDTTRYYVIPSSLQMGWKNSPAYFCTATDLTRKLVARVLSLTRERGLPVPHRYDEHVVPGTIGVSKEEEISEQCVIELQVFVDDFMNGVATPKGDAKLGSTLRWVGRSAMHGIHAVFPPPEILQHVGGKDSISTKKVLKGDATFAREKEMLGKWLKGYSGRDRTVGLPKDKVDKYIAAVQEAIDSPAHRVSLEKYQKVLGKVQYSTEVMPAMKGFMTPLNQALAGKLPGSFVGLGKASEVREVLTEIIPMLRLAWEEPSHVTEIVPTDLPHYYGTTDAAGVGFGGVMLPCTKWLEPTVWRLPMPKDLEDAVTEGSLTMVDCEFIGYFIGNCILHDLIAEAGEPLAGMNSHFLSDNSPTVGIVTRQASRAKSPTPARTLRWLALRQRHYRTGPQTIQHWPGEQNAMADIPSRSYSKGFPEGSDDEFLAHFSSLFPLPTQLGSWRLAAPRAEICSAAFSLLRKIKEPRLAHPNWPGGDGLTLPAVLAKTLTWESSKDPSTSWNESTCAWPLLLPCGKACSIMESPLQGRPLRERYATAGRSWQTEDLRTLARAITPAANSTPDLSGI